MFLKTCPVKIFTKYITNLKNSNYIIGSLKAYLHFRLVFACDRANSYLDIK